MSTVRGSNTLCAAKYHIYYLVSHGLPHSRACPVKAATSSIGTGNTIVEFCNVITCQFLVKAMLSPTFSAEMVPRVCR